VKGQDLNVGDWLIVWTIRLSMLLFFIAWMLRLQPHLGRSRSRPWLNYLWTAGYLMAVLHVLAAFHFVHHWSPAAAYQATAEETRQMLGFAYGAGVYFNYLFLIVWGCDVCWTWLSPSEPERPTPWWIRWGRGYLLFIAFNGVVIFEAGLLRILGSLAAVVFVGQALRKRSLERTAWPPDRG